MPRENAQAKARRYLTEGRITLTHVDQHTARAVIRGDGSHHHVTVTGPTWTCTCPARTRCSHQIAVGLVIAIDL